MAFKSLRWFCLAQDNYLTKLFSCPLQITKKPSEILQSYEQFYLVSLWQTKPLNHCL